ncbi:hypothetical protein [Flavobacterium sp. 25HG05S-40]|uniref:hypothetical protein n=1 Tax=Flavobacterium sp. 25HG05S-40 TaxID=3458682 RepID=UPI004044CB4E
MKTIPYIFKDVENLMFIGDKYYPIRKALIGCEQCPDCTFYESPSGKKFKTTYCETHLKQSIEKVKHLKEMPRNTGSNYGNYSTYKAKRIEEFKKLVEEGKIFINTKPLPSTNSFREYLEQIKPAN